MSFRGAIHVFERKYEKELTTSASPSSKNVGVQGGGAGGTTDPPKFGEDQIRASSSDKIGKNKFLSMIKTEKFSKIGNDEQQEFGY